MHALLVALVLASTSPPTLPEHLTAPLCVGCATAPADAVPDLARLRAGEILSLQADEPDARQTVEMTALVAHRPTQVWAILTDFANRPAWQPSARGVTVVRVDGPRVWVDEWARFFFFDIRYRLALTLDTEDGVIDFVMDEESPHDIGDVRGRWQLRHVDEGRKTLVTYRASIDFGLGLPQWLQRALVRYSLPSLLANLRAEADRRFGASPS